MKPRNIVLASNSPRRKALLEQLRLPFKAVPTFVDESRNVSENAKNLVERISEKKARSVEVEDDSLIIAADTVINLKEKIFGKPFSKEDGFLMLRELSGKVHKVHTGVCMVLNKNREIFSVQTDVYFRELTDEMIDWYWSLDESKDKAGSYAIQEWIGIIGIKWIKGSYFNVMGLPTEKVYSELIKFSDDEKKGWEQKIPDCKICW